MIPSVRIVRLTVVALTAAVVLLGLPLLILARSPRAAPTWSDPSPAATQWIATLPVTAAITASNDNGLDDATAAYQISTDGGGTWSGWRTANLQVGGTVSTTRRITVANLSLGEGSNLIQYRMADVAGALGVSPAHVLRVDTQGPGAPINPLLNPSGWTNNNSFAVSWTNPADPNGIGGVWYKVGSTPLAGDDGVFVSESGVNRLTGIAVPGDGVHTMWFWLADKLGNANHFNAAVVVMNLDTTAPGALTDIAATPSGWSKENRFALSWTAPSDRSGIAGVRYQLDLPPASADAGTFLPGAVSGIDNFTLPSSGQHTLWLWPVDNAGNANASAARSVTLYLDTLAPGIPNSPVIIPGGWQTTTNSFTLSWVNPSDPSGIAAAWYKLGSEPVGNRDGTRWQDRTSTRSPTSSPLRQAAIISSSGLKTALATSTLTIVTSGSTPSAGTLYRRNSSSTATWKPDSIIGMSDRLPSASLPAMWGRI